MKKKLTAMVFALAAQFMAVCAFAETIDLWTLNDETVKILNSGDVATGRLLSTTHGSAVVSIAPGATVTISNVTINGDGDMAQGNAGITCLGNATIILKGNNVVRGLDPNYPGIFVPPGKTLTIKGGGRLEAYGSEGAGIGGGYSFVPYTDDRSCGNVVIEGGTVIAESRVAAGIGSGHSGTLNGGGSCGDIVINGGTVKATGAAAGIGGASGGDTSRCGDITINGGNVTATCTGVDGPGIGACSSGRCGAITINGGSVTANARAKEDQGSEKGSCAAGIGTGAYGRCGVITINGGSVVANGGCCYPYTRLLFGSGHDPEGVASGAGIGSGFSGNCEGVIVNGGNVKAHGGCGITDPSYKISVFGDYVDGGGAAGIGAGGFFRIHGNAARSSACGDIVISGGSIISEGGVLAAGIGAGYDANCGDIFLRGATVYAAGHSGPGIGVGLTSKCGRIAFRSGKPLYVRSVVLDREYSFAVGATIARSSYEGITLEDGLVDNATWGEKVIRERMIFWNGDLNFINEDSTLIDGSFATGLACGNWKLSIADGATVMISNVTINGSNSLNYKWAGITCEGNATIILKGANVVKGYDKDYPGIYVPPGKKLTIKGDGSLTASSGGRGAGIGGGYEIDSGHIDIEGGSVTATGGDYAAGIGSGYNADCGNIMIKPGITHVTATYGANGVKPIGNGYGGEPAGYNAAGLNVKTAGSTLYISPGTISGPDEISGAGETVLQDGDILTGEITGKRKISIAADATVTISDVTLDGLNEGGYANTDWAGITCLGNATIILEGGNYVAGYNQYQPGIHVPVGSTLTIKGGGSLIAYGAERAAGIGGAWKLACGNIVIESGHVEAHGGSDAAGLGGGFMGACGDIAIEGGYVWATGGKDAAGIGSGSFSSCGNITITGAEVAATGNGSAAGIGGGNGGEIGSIYIGEGIVRVAATRGANAKYHIGRYSGDDPGDVTMAENLGDTLVDGTVVGDNAVRIIAPLVTVTFDANGGAVSPATRKVVKGGYIGELPVPVKSDYEFNGWFFNPLFNFDAAKATDVASGSLTLYAKWTDKTPTTWTVTFDGNGGTVGESSREVTKGAAVGQLPSATRAGWTFNGWFTAPDGGMEINADDTVVDDIDLYAQWTQSGDPGSGGPCVAPLDPSGIKAAYSAPKAVTLKGAAYDGCDVVGIVELKLGKVNAKKRTSKVSGSVTTLDGKKHAAKGVTVTGIDGSAPATVALEVKGLGTMSVTIGGSQFAGTLGGEYHVQSAAVGGAWAGGSAVASVEPDGLSAFSGVVLSDFLPTNEVAAVSGGKWKFEKAASVKWAKPKKGAGLPAIYDEASHKGLIVDTSKGTNLSGLKLTYKPKKGTFKGTFNVYALEGSGSTTKLKKHKLRVSGVVVDGVGHGKATCKRPALSWPVEVE